MMLGYDRNLEKWVQVNGAADIVNEKLPLDFFQQTYRKINYLDQLLHLMKMLKSQAEGIGPKGQIIFIFRSKENNDLDGPLAECWEPMFNFIADIRFLGDHWHCTFASRNNWETIARVHCIADISKKDVLPEHYFYFTGVKIKKDAVMNVKDSSLFYFYLDVIKRAAATKSQNDSHP